MWTRSELKNRAKEVLRKNYWQAFLISLVLLVSGNTESQGPSFTYRMNSQHGAQNPFIDLPPEWMTDVLPLLVMLGFGIFLSVVAFRVLIGYPLEMGGRRYFNEAVLDRGDFQCLGHAFNRRWYMNVVIAMLLRGLSILAWTLLLIIPGIIKSYAYRFVPYILADNPEIPPSRALALSNQMTAGHKMNMFVLDLSFLGWYLLGLAAFGVGTVFVHPYVNATMAELYRVLRREALQQGVASQDELKPMETGSMY